MKDRPILFSGPMVRAILSGAKTQTRRIVNPQPVMHDFGVGGVNPAFMPPQITCGFLAIGMETMLKDNFAYLKILPYGNTGDRLWVKETSWFDTRAPQDCVIYDATPEIHKYQSRGITEPCDPEITIPYLEAHKFWKRRPSIFMRRSMSSLTLKIESVRVEQLQSISSDDCVAEGVEAKNAGLGSDASWRQAYRQIWESINGPDSWNINPWVWVISFKVA